MKQDSPFIPALIIIAILCLPFVWYGVFMLERTINWHFGGYSNAVEKRIAPLEKRIERLEHEIQR